MHTLLVTSDLLQEAAPENLLRLALWEASDCQSC